MNEIKLDIRKKLVLDIKKELNITAEKAQVVLALDFSGSMSTLYSNGAVQELLERLLPIALNFDDNGSIDFYLFHNSFIKVKDITKESIDGLAAKIYKEFSMGGTSYSPVINEIKDVFSGKTSKSTKSFLGGLFTKSTETSKLEYPVYVIFITDGENSDRNEAEKAIIAASNHGIFFQFVGIGSEKFNFLQRLDTMSGRNIDNANFFKVPDLSKVTDDQLYRLLLAEFPEFIKLARAKNMIQ